MLVAIGGFLRQGQELRLEAVAAVLHGLEPFQGLVTVWVFHRP